MLHRLAAALAAGTVALAIDGLLVGIVAVDSSLVVVSRRMHPVAGEPLVFRDPHSSVAVIGHVAHGVPQHGGQVLIDELMDDYGPLPSALVEGVPLLLVDAARGVTLFR